MIDQPLGFIGSSQPVGFFALIIIGGLAGWFAGMILGHRHSIITNILIGIAGSYIGSELAQLFNFGLRNSLDHFFAALGGAIIFDHLSRIAPNQHLLATAQLIGPRPRWKRKRSLPELWDRA
jgi:uncharacterized membrane protein YeaQ/YmgE (transglycosylase-associated protein family)